MLGKTITLAHGNGGKYSHEIISSLFVKAFDNSALTELTDAALISADHAKLAFTTDSHVVSPIFFPGGDIGKLAVSGTINDLAVMGAKPLYLSCGFIIEEGFGIDDLQRIVQSMSNTANEIGVKIVTGDTKVVEKGAADGIFINTSGIGVMLENAPQGIATVQVGDAVILSGSLGDHGISIYAEREKLLLRSPLESDCAIVLSLVEAAIDICHSIRIMRDPTRGGLATTLNEFVMGRAFGIEINEEAIPVKEPVQAVCEMLGFDPLYIANEGKVVMIVPSDSADDVVCALQEKPMGKSAKVIGQVTDRFKGKVCMKTLVGGERIIDMLIDDPFPRIC
jgi:hydrogenase expression/formation protein HypE